MKIVFLGLSITSSWGNGHATTYRGLVRELVRRGYEVMFFERDVPWYASNRDMDPKFSDAEVVLYQSIEELDAHAASVESADAVIVGSYVPEGIRVCDWVLERASGVTVFYDIDTPVTLARMAAGDCEYLSTEQISQFQLYLSFSGGPTLRRLEKEFGSPCARAFYCSVDPEQYYPENVPHRWDLGYLGTYSDDRQPGLDRMLVDPARQWSAGQFVVAGPQYPDGIKWPENVERIEHLAPYQHRRFYNSQRFTLNVTRADMILAGHSPSVRLFEAAACGTPIISDWWEGLDELFEIGTEILVVEDRESALTILQHMTPEQRMAIGTAARRRVLAGHTSAHRAEELERHLIHAGTGALAFTL